MSKKKTAAGTRRLITFTLPETLEIIIKPGIYTSQSVITAAYKMGLISSFGTKKNARKKLPI
jgi:hypothetical protein